MARNLKVAGISSLISLGGVIGIRNFVVIELFHSLV